MHFDWNETRLDRLRALVHDGVTHRDIAIRLFSTTTARNAVNGMIHRHGFKPGEAAQAERELQRTRRLHKRQLDEERRQRDRHLFGDRDGNGRFLPGARIERPARKPRQSQLHQPANPIWGSEAPVGGPDTSLRCTLVELTSRRCAFPIGEPTDRENFRYCGAPVAHRSYCAHCFRVVYVPPRARVTA